MSKPTPTRPKTLSGSGGGVFQTLIAGWEYNTNQGKGVTANTLVSFPSKSIQAQLPPVPDVKVSPASTSASETQEVINPQQQQSQQQKLSPSQQPTTARHSSAGLGGEALRPNSIFNSQLFSSTTSSASSGNLYSGYRPSSPSSSSSCRNAALREQFLMSSSNINGGSSTLNGLGSSTSLGTSPTDSPSKQGSGGGKEQWTSHAPTTPTTPSGLPPGYRYAGVERLAQRSKMYEVPIRRPPLTSSATRLGVSSIERKTSVEASESGVESVSCVINELGNFRYPRAECIISTHVCWYFL